MPDFTSWADAAESNTDPNAIVSALQAFAFGNTTKVSLKDHKLQSFSNKSEYSIEAFFQQFKRATISLDIQALEE